MKSFLIVLTSCSLLTACMAPSYNQTARVQEQLACSSAGFVPGSNNFIQCVGSLDLTEDQERSIN